MMAREDEYKKVLEEIDELESMIPDGMFSSENRIGSQYGVKSVSWELVLKE